MSIELEQSFYVSPCYLPAIWYGDRSGLNEFDCKALDDFLNDLKQVFEIDCPLFDARGEDTSWQRCDISMLFNECVRLDVYGES